jgi:5,10-methenyltetrahydromethanopterin hydrogenase
MSGKKVVEITSWEQLAEIPKTCIVEIETDEKVFKFPVEGLPQETIEEINEKWDAKKNELKEPKSPVRIKGGGVNWVADPESAEHKEWKKKVRAIENLRTADLTLAFLPEGLRPSGSFEEKVEQLRGKITFGHWGKIVEAGMKASGVDLSDRMDEAKNS